MDGLSRSPALALQIAASTRVRCAAPRRDGRGDQRCRTRIDGGDSPPMGILERPRHLYLRRCRSPPPLERPTGRTPPCASPAPRPCAPGSPTSANSRTRAPRGRAHHTVSYARRIAAEIDALPRCHRVAGTAECGRASRSCRPCKGTETGAPATKPGQPPGRPAPNAAGRTASAPSAPRP